MRKPIRNKYYRVIFGDIEVEDATEGLLYTVYREDSVGAIRDRKDPRVFTNCTTALALGRAHGGPVWVGLTVAWVGMKDENGVRIARRYQHNGEIVKLNDTGADIPTDGRTYRLRPMSHSNRFDTKPNRHKDLRARKKQKVEKGELDSVNAVMPGFENLSKARRSGGTWYRNGSSMG